MNTNPTSDIDPSRVDDIPLLLTQMMQMGIADLLDANFPTLSQLEWPKFRVDCYNLVNSYLVSSRPSFKQSSRLGC